MVRELRERVIDVIAGYKAYDVPNLSKRVGLADGDGQEAFSSKARYVKVRLEGLPSADVIRTGKALLQEDDDFRLSEIVRKIDPMVPCRSSASS